ncbi:MAG: cellulase family glycosylhydrolase [Oscillospiraceae bacterium]|nr:cellulase family glycosylhydrolase [Oscillospiraceae bacterium]
MKLRKIAAVFLAALMCVLAVTASVSAATVKKGVKLNKSKVTMYVGSSYTLKPTVTGYSKYTLQWSTSDKSVVTVKSGGKITAKKAGTATVTVKIKGTKVKASCKVTVKNKNVVSSDKTSKSGTYFDTAQELVSKMTIGWNLGNTLDCYNCTWLSNKMDCETAWGNPKTTKKMITMVKKAGFNTIRIPVSWNDHMDSKGNIDKKWMDRVQEVVDYAYDSGMYVILNSHHELNWLKLDSASEKNVTAKFKNMWKQIATRFKDYDEKLLFEGMNEPRTEGSAKEWNGGTIEERKAINKLYKVFVDTVRATGGTNKTRVLVINPYGASTNYNAMSELEIPDDDKIAVSVHAYMPYNTALNRYSSETKLTDSGKKDIDYAFSNINKVFLSKGIPVIMGEFGTMNKDNTKERIEIAKYYVSVANKYGVPCIWWDNGTICKPSDGEGFGLLDRRNLKWFFEDIVKALVNTAK